MKRDLRGITLLELIIALSVFFLVVTAVASMDVFARNQLVVLQRKAKLQNELTQLFVQIQKQGVHIIDAPGTTNPVTVHILPGSYTYVEFWTDANNNGISDPAGLLQDRPIGYVHIPPVGGAPAPALGQVWYFPNSGANPTINYNPTASPEAHEVLALGILDFTVTESPTLNYMTIAATACWNIANPGTCNSHDNPTVTMRTTLSLPMVAAN